MKKNRKNIFVFIFLYLVIYITISFILKALNLTFLAWIKNISIIIVSIGIIIGFIQIARNIDKDKKIRKILLYIFIIILAFIIFIINTFYFVIISNTEEYSEYEGKKMIKETRSVLKSNYINYYDYINPFIRSNQERVHIAYDDAISEDEYGGTYFYNEEGKQVENIEGTEFIDLSSLKKYASENGATFEKVQELLKELYNNYEDKIFKVETSDNYLFIYLTNIDKKLVVEETKKQNLKDKIQSFLTIESEKKDSCYRIRFWNGYIAICNYKYLNY